MRQEENIVTLHRILYDIAKKVSPKAYTDERPKAVNEKDEAFIVYKCSTFNRRAYMSGMVYFDMYIRDRENGLLNEEVLERYQQGIMEQFPYVNDCYTLKNPMLTSLGSDNKGFHVYRISTNLMITYK